MGLERSTILLPLQARVIFLYYPRAQALGSSVATFQVAIVFDF